jgi:hypothetical protein
MTIKMLTEMAMTTGTAKIQMLSPVSIQQLKNNQKKLILLKSIDPLNVNHDLIKSLESFRNPGAKKFQ